MSIVILAIGELVSIWSKARIPSLLVILIGYLLLNWAGFFPQGVVSSSALSVFGALIGGFLGSKLFKWDPLKGLPVALTALFGFPGDYIICEEVSRSVGRDEKERQAILDEILTPMLVGGFTTVTTASVLIASILIKTL